MSLLSKKDRDALADLEFITDASAGQLMRTPRTSRVLLIAGVGMLVAFLVWGAVFTIDETIRGTGKAVPVSSVQVLQNLEGGIVETIHVREGQTVSAGEVLLELDETQAGTSLEETRDQYYSLLGQSIRLEAEVEQTELVFPAELSENAPGVIRDQTRNFRSNQRALEEEEEQTNLQIEQIQRQRESAEAQLVDAKEETSLLNQQREANVPLVESGAVASQELLRIDQEIARSRSTIDRLENQLPELDAQIAELRSRLESIGLRYRDEAGDELAEVDAKLQVMESTLNRVSDVMARTEIRSPVNGIIKKMHITTVGGVVRPGVDIVEIVPIDDEVIIEAEIKPKDVGFLIPGMPAKVRVSAFDFAVYGGLDGTVETISADSLVDQRGRSFYIAKVRVDRSSFDHGDQTLRVIPGMQATVDIKIAERNALQYILKPLLRVVNN